MAPPEEGQAEPRVGATALHARLLWLPPGGGQVHDGPALRARRSLFGDSGKILGSLGSQEVKELPKPLRSLVIYHPKSYCIPRPLG